MWIFVKGFEEYIGCFLISSRGVRYSSSVYV